MKNIFRKLLKQLLRPYDLDKMDYGEYNRTMMTIYFTVIAIFGCAIYILIDGIAGYTTFLISDLIVVTIYFLILLIIQEGLITAAKYILIINTNFAFFVSGLAQGREAGNFFMWYPMFACIFMLFSLKEKRHIIILYILTSSSLITLEYFDYSLLSMGVMVREYQYLSYLYTMIASVILTSMLVYNLTKLNNLAENKLAKLNNRLHQRNSDLIKANKELDSFVYKASHDLRAPLTSLLGLIEIAKSENNIDKLKEYLSLQEKSIHKLDSYILQILNLSRNARSAINIEQIDFQKILNESIDQLSYLKQASTIKKHIIIQQDTPFYSDPKRLNIIFNNVVANAYQYYSNFRDESYLKINIEVDKEKAVIVFEDNGIGIPKSHLQSVFNMFFRTNNNGTGSGLGLYIVKETVNMLKGKIELDSEVNHWTRFSFTLPNGYK